MSKFDTQLWKERAWARFTRTVAPLRSRDKKRRDAAERKWAEDVVAIGGLAKVVAWCAERCIDVDFVKKPLGTYHYGLKEISISSRLKPLNQLIILLHECGHHLVGDAEAHDRFGMGYPQTDPEVTKTFHHRVACLEEEMEAWHRGWKLAQRLELNLDREEFDRVRLDCVRSYIQWSLKPGRWEMPAPKEVE
jgi:hypothetical protein